MLIRPTRRSVLAGMASSFALPAFAQSPSGNAVIYTSNSEQAVTAVQDTARKLLPNIKISTITGGSGQLLRRLEAEAAKPQGDVFWSSSANTLGAFKQLFEPWKAPDLNAILPALRDPDNLWTAANIHVVVAMINKNQLGGAPMPKTWTDLLDPRLKGKIIIADPANSSTAYTILWGVEKMLGTDALKKLAQNTKVSSAAAAVLRSVGQGEYAVGLTFESNAYAYVAGGQKEISLLYPEDGTFTTAEYLTLIKNAPAGAIAKNVCELLISKECQIALLEGAYRRPSRTDIDVSKYVDLPDLAKIKVFATNEDEAAAKRADFLARWQAMVAAAN
ncbi:MAG: extracellular solute-binding protein [Beijerinckiaceae bacterium]|nr:extracellular solute-binding protein [Beijerinckiaceae bacterium]